MDSASAAKTNPTAKYLPDRDRVSLVINGRPRIISVCFEPTNRCPGRCPYCLIEDHDGDFSFGILRSTLDALMKHGTMRYGFGGGEPLLRSDIYELGRYVRQRGMGSLLRTSGMFPMVPSASSEAFDWIDLSFDSVDPETFRRCRPGVPYEVLVSNLKVLVAAGMRVRVSVLITSRNLRTVDQTVWWLASEGVRDVRLQRLVSRGRARTTWRSLHVPVAIEDDTIARMVALGNELDVDVRELRTISNTTLCVVKGDGDLFSGEPDGITYRGSVFRNEQLHEIAESLFAAQVAAYVDA